MSATRLVHALERGDLCGVEDQLEAAPNVDDRVHLVQTTLAGSGQTLLIRACTLRKADIVRALLKAVPAGERRWQFLRAQHAPDPPHDTALHISVEMRSRDCVKALLDSGIQNDEVKELLRALDGNGHTALHRASIRDIPELVDDLLLCDAELLAIPVGGQDGGRTALELAVKEQNSDATRSLAEHLARALEKPEGWAPPLAKVALSLAARQRETGATEVLAKCLPPDSFNLWQDWQDALQEALDSDLAEMVAVMARASPELISVEVLEAASQRKSFCALSQALAQPVSLQVENAGNSAPVPLVPMAHPERTPEVVSCSCQSSAKPTVVIFSAEQKRLLEATPWYAPWGRANLCVAHRVPAHLLSLSDKSLWRVLKLLALNPQVEVFRTPFAQAVVAVAWGQVWRLYYLDIFLIAVHIGSAVALALTVWMARPMYFPILLVTVSLLVAKDLGDEFFQLRKLGLDYLKLSENWFDFVRVCVEMTAMVVLWLKLTNTFAKALVAAWVGWTWIHGLTELRGHYGLGHMTIPMLQAMFDRKVAALGLVLVFCILGATNAYYVFAQHRDPYDAFRAVFGLAMLGDLESWNTKKEGAGYVVVQAHIFILCFVFIVPVPLFISVLGNTYSQRVQQAAESFLCARAMLAVEYNVATLRRLLRLLQRCGTGHDGAPRAPASTEVQVLISQEVSQDLARGV